MTRKKKISEKDSARRLPSGEEIAPDDWALAHSVNKGETIVDELAEVHGSRFNG